MGFFHINHPFGGIPILGNPQFASFEGMKGVHPDDKAELAMLELSLEVTSSWDVWLLLVSPATFFFLGNDEVVSSLKRRSPENWGIITCQNHFYSQVERLSRYLQPLFVGWAWGPGMPQPISWYHGRRGDALAMDASWNLKMDQNA